MSSEPSPIGACANDAAARGHRPRQDVRRRAASCCERSKAVVQAVSDVSFDVGRGETLSLVGESGCGKSTTAPLRAAARRARQRLDHVRRHRADRPRRPRSCARLRRRFQMVFQDPQASLNPRMTVRELLGEPLRVHGDRAIAEDARVDELLDLVQLPRSAPAAATRTSSPAASASASASPGPSPSGPDLLVLDEPVSALDVSIQAEIIRLLERLRSELDLGFLFIAHDLSVVRHISDRVAVMYLGRIVETGTAEQVYGASAASVHPGAAVGGADPRPAHRARPPAHRARGRAADADRPAVGLPLPHPLLEGDRRLRRGRPRSSTDPGVGHAVACHHPEPVDVVARTEPASRPARSPSRTVRSRHDHDADPSTPAPASRDHELRDRARRRDPRRHVRPPERDRDCRPASRSSWPRATAAGSATSTATSTSTSCAATGRSCSATATRPSRRRPRAQLDRGDCQNGPGEVARRAGRALRRRRRPCRLGAVRQERHRRHDDVRDRRPRARPSGARCSSPRAPTTAPRRGAPRPRPAWCPRTGPTCCTTASTTSSR